MVSSSIPCRAVYLKSAGAEGVNAGSLVCTWLLPYGQMAAVRTGRIGKGVHGPVPVSEAH